MLTISSTLPENVSLAEIYQSCKVKMAILNKLSKDSFERITPFVMCRDFLTDVCSFSTVKQKFQIYGMEFDSREKKVDFGQVSLLLNFPSTKELKCFQSALDYLHATEAKNKIQLTSFTEHKPLQWVVQGDKQWSQNCLLFSLYTLLLRSMCMSESDAKKSTDGKLIASVNPKQFQNIMDNLPSIETTEFCGFTPNSKDISRIHHNSGFISVFGKHREINYQSVRENTHWQEMKKRGFTLHKEATK